MKFILLVSICLFALNSFSQENWEPRADSLISCAKTQLGVPYIWATSTPNKSFDCSGFTSYVYGTFDITKCRSSKGYGNIGEKIDLKNTRKGDCILFRGTTPGSKTIGHIGIVVENDENGLKFIHCSSSKAHFGVVITDYYSSGYPKRFLQARRLF
ncbi:MAG: lipoprotein Spr [Crocinitomicaceae bacterium]|jgi:lipoprotein Spr